MKTHPMHPCATCGSPVQEADPTCPTCGQVLEERGTSIRPAALFALLGLSLTGCVDGGDDDEVTALYGVPVTDADEDGWGVEEGDCDDSDDTIYPEAEELPGDGVDSNCDGDDDT